MTRSQMSSVGRGTQTHIRTSLSAGHPPDSHRPGMSIFAGLAGYGDDSKTKQPREDLIAWKGVKELVA
jgi:hypothetical protein